MSEPWEFRRKSVLTIHEAALVLGLSGSRVRGMIAEGLLAEHGRIRIENHELILVKRDDVERLMREGWPRRRQKPMR